MRLCTVPCLLLFLLPTLLPCQSLQAESKISRKDRKAFTAAVAALSDPEIKAAKRKVAIATLTKGFPRSREFLHHTVRYGAPLAKQYALRLLGENGNVQADLEVVATALHDNSESVRRVALLAIRRLGPEGLSFLISFVPKEEVANNRKVAIKTIERWQVKEAIPTLVDWLDGESNKGVRNFLIVALERLSGKKFGHDVEKWKRFSHAWQEDQATKELLRAREKSLQEGAK